MSLKNHRVPPTTPTGLGVRCLKDVFVRLVRDPDLDVASACMTHAHHLLQQLRLGAPSLGGLTFFSRKFVYMYIYIYF